MIYNGGLLPLNNTFLLYIQFNDSVNTGFQIDVNGRILNQYTIGEEIAAKNANKALIVSGGLGGTAWVIDNLSSYLKTGAKSIVGSVATTSRGIDAANNLHYIATRAKYSDDLLASLTDISSEIFLDYFSAEKLIGADGSLLLKPQSSPYKWKISTDKGVTFTDVVEASTSDVLGLIYDATHYLQITFPGRTIDFYGPSGLRSKTLWGDVFYGAGWIDATRCAFAAGLSGEFRIYLFNYETDTISLLHTTTDYAGFSNQRISHSNGYLFVPNHYMVEVISLINGPVAQINLSTIFGSTTSNYGRLYVADFFN
ncbi:MAG: hypothetical protein JXQ80_13015 [Bacteroidales bacterium]|nr:hypothetical protein [Bacteroidales bacterium]